MTNAHVVDGADEVIVTLTDKRELKARIVGTDRRTDVAVVKVEATGLPFVKIGDVNRLKVGEWVMAIGSPFGLENTVTAGIVSAKQRDTGDYLPFIQTDVAINPGNSGGPLLNLRGEVVGINSQIYSRSGGFMGISFAIPIDEAMRVADQLRTNGRVIRGRIGVQITQVTKEVAESIGLASRSARWCRASSPAARPTRPGVEAGDIILGRRQAVEKSGDLPRLIGSTSPGSKSTLQVFRRGNTRELTVTVGEFEPERTASRTEAAPEPKASAPVKSARSVWVWPTSPRTRSRSCACAAACGWRAWTGRRRAPACAKATSCCRWATPRSPMPSSSRRWPPGSRRTVPSACWCAAASGSTISSCGPAADSVRGGRPDRVGCRVFPLAKRGGGGTCVRLLGHGRQK
jgi:S1-C subfamily serine protease